METVCLAVLICQGEVVPLWPGSIAELPGQVILVSNEVGQGIVPMGELSRRFVDEAGWLHQDIARIANNVTLVVAGLPMVLKGL